MNIYCNAFLPAQLLVSPRAHYLCILLLIFLIVTFLILIIAFCSTTISIRLRLGSSSRLCREREQSAAASEVGAEAVRVRRNSFTTSTASGAPRPRGVLTHSCKDFLVAWSDLPLILKILKCWVDVEREQNKFKFYSSFFDVLCVVFWRISVLHVHCFYTNLIIFNWAQLHLYKILAYTMFLTVGVALKQWTIRLSPRKEINREWQWVHLNKKLLSSITIYTTYPT